MYRIYERTKRLVNTDSLCRCYNGCYKKSDWMYLEKTENASRINFWRELNAYSVNLGVTLKEYKMEEIPVKCGICVVCKKYADVITLEDGSFITGCCGGDVIGEVY